MARRAARGALLSVEEYLRFEESSPIKHEYVAGRIYAMSGVTIRHNLITGNIYAALRAATRGGPCRALATDVKLQAAGDVFYYPDAMVTCQATAMDDRIVGGPCLAVEVTSPSTRRIDHHEKLLAYRGVPSLRTYLVVEQAERVVAWHRRDADGTWRHDTVTDAWAEGGIDVPCPGVTLTLDDIYEGITFEPPRPRPRRVHEPVPT